jgi:hypothetical protein
MTYLKLKWLEAGEKYPVWLYSELDAERWETRKVDVFADGTMAWADETTDDEMNTALGSTPAPTFQEIANDPEFEAEEISREQFEVIWNEATKAF